MAHRKFHAWSKPLISRMFLFGAVMVGIMMATATTVAQEYDWSLHRTIPGFDPETEPPILIADQNGTVHAISSQQLGREGDQSVTAIMYNQWTVANGWSMAVDILLSPLKSEARILDAFLDQSGMMHLVFFGGDGTEANVYYSKAPATSAGQASSWSTPVLVGPMAHDPQNGGIAGDGQGNMVIIYSGDRFGVGWYIITSTDGGNTWSAATLLFPTYDKEYSPFYLRTHIGDSGLLQAVWSIQDINNHGQGIYYANFDFDTMRWSAPIQLAEKEAGNLGTQVPIIIEFDGSLFVMHYDSRTRQMYFLKSDDGGRSWSEPVAPFPHVGLNGPGYFVVDSTDVLHLLWSQRLSGPPDTHGVWHSTWQETGWSDFEAIVSGPKVLDQEGFGAFDPNTIKAAVSNGNAVLVTWRTDRGSRGNGVWFSTTILDAPPLPVLPLPTVPAAVVVDNAVDELAETPEPTRKAVPDFPDQVDVSNLATDNLSEGIFTSLVPVTFLILIFAIFRQISQSRRR